MLTFAKHFLYSTALVAFMSLPCLVLLYAGMVRKKNALATVMQSFAITCIVTVIWTVVCYSLVFTPGGAFHGKLSRVMLHGMDYIEGGKVKTLTLIHLAPTVPETVYCLYQMTFSIVTPALLKGAFSDRVKFSVMLIVMTLRSIIVYSPIAHMVWEPTGWLASAGILDFTSRTALHIHSILRIWFTVPRAASIQAKART